MFSTMIKELRQEAELASAANAMMLLNSRTQGWSLVDKLSGKSTKDRTLATGMGVGMGGVLSVVGVAMANQAAGMVGMYAGMSAAQVAAASAVGLSTSAGTFTTLLAGASTALASLGTIAVGASVLPVATVVALGAGVAGIAVMGVSAFMSVDHGKSVELSNALKANDKHAINEFGRSNLGVSDWLVGAKNFVSKALWQKHVTQEAPSVGQVQETASAAIEYELADLFANTLGESERDKQALVEGIAGEMWDKHGVVVTNEKIHACLGDTRVNELSTGKVLAVDTKSGLVLQSIGRGQATVHKLKDFEKVPVVGQDITVQFKGGQMQKAPERGQSLAVGR